MSKKLLRLFLIIFILFPLLFTLIWAFTENWEYGKLFPQVFSIRAWKSLFLNKNNIKIILNSLYISFIASIISIIISYPAAKAIALYDFKGKSLFRLIVFLPIVIPVTSVAIGLHLNLLRLGLANTKAGVILVHAFPAIPYAFMILEPIFSSIGENYENQAILLGASGLKKFLYVNLPMMLPGLRSSFFMSFVVSFSQYFLTFLIGGGLVKTYSTIVFPVISNKDRHEASVFSIVFILILLLVGFITFRLGNRKEDD